MVITSKDIREKLKDIDEFLLDRYKQNKEEKERDWRTYEEQYALRIKEAMKQLKPLISEAADSIQISKAPGRPHELTLKQRVLLLLLQRLFQESNRMMASMLAIFSVLTDVDVSYKTIERLYSDEEVEMALHNLHIIILRKKGVNNVDASGDGTGYSLSIRNHYASETEKRKDEAKEASTNEKMAFVYSFKLIDNKTGMYITYGTSLKSEKRAFDKAMEMLQKIDVRLSSVRLDRYYSFPCYVDRFHGTKVFIIPRKNATLRGSWKWKRTMFDFVENTLPYLEQYYQREKSENGWSVDKRRFGWGIAQRRFDRIDTADFCTGLWHNLFLIDGA
jgi:transposase